CWVGSGNLAVGVACELVGLGGVLGAGRTEPNCDRPIVHPSLFRSGSHMASSGGIFYFIIFYFFCFHDIFGESFGRFAEGITTFNDSNGRGRLCDYVVAGYNNAAGVRPSPPRWVNLHGRRTPLLRLPGRMLVVLYNCCGKRRNAHTKCFSLWKAMRGS
ncbi:hypothetical protein TraAM80_09835, partial [Trypanosoma rangeli]